MAILNGKVVIQTKKYNCIFLDRDGTLNPDPGYISSISSFSFYEFTLKALSRIANKGNVFCIITNQSGVGRGLIEIEDLEEINDFIKREFRSHSINLLDIYYCVDHPNKATQRRKPGVGMFYEAKKDHELSLSDSLMVGDSMIDIVCGKKLNMDTMLVLTGNGEKTLKLLPEKFKPTYIVTNLEEGAELLCLIK